MKRVTFVVGFEAFPTDANALAELLFGKGFEERELAVAQRLFADLSEIESPPWSTLVQTFMEGTSLPYEAGEYRTAEGRFDWDSYEKDRQQLAQTRLQRFMSLPAVKFVRILHYPDIPGDTDSEILMYEGAFDNLPHERLLESKQTR